MPFKSESYRPLTSIVSYPERGSGGNNRYRGNCSPKLIEDLIAFFKPEEICDYMCGSGTTKAAAQKSGIRSHLYDLHSGFDIMNCDIPERPEFIFWHPPYWICARCFCTTVSETRNKNRQAKPRLELYDENTGEIPGLSKNRCSRL